MLTNYLQIEYSTNGVATVWIDQEGEKVNKVSPEAMNIFNDTFAKLELDPNVKAVVLMSRKKDFIAGADIDVFKTIKKKGDFTPVIKKGHELLAKLENSTKPVVAGINGSCLGGGLEIALACRARIASEDAKLALPEVQLGLLPGAGGTQRLPRLIGVQKALDMMLTGKNIFARPALKMGLVDMVVHKNMLHKAAIQLALSLLKKPLERKVKKSLVEKMLDNTAIGRSIVFKKARQMTLKMTKGNYPSPMYIIDCVEAGMKYGIKKGIEVESEKFETLILSPESAELVNIFFNMTAKKKNPAAQLATKVNTMGVLGSGLMGGGIAQVSADKGISVLLKDLKPENLALAKKSIWKELDKKVKKKALTKIEADKTISNIITQTDYANFENADIVIEAVFEDLGVKQKILAEFEAVAHENSIFASNTSALPITAIAQYAKHPENVIGMHYFSPVPKMPLLEIVKTEKTSDKTIATCFELGIRQGKTCIVVKDGPGFYTTRILAPLLNEALLLLEDGASIQQIDKVMTEWGFPVGPVTLLDEVGIDVGAHVMSGDLIQHFIKERGEMRISQVLLKMKNDGYAGRKNGKGFYLYDDKGKKIKGKINEAVYSYFGGSTRKEFPKDEIWQRCALAMVNEAVTCLDEGIIDNTTDGDIGAVFGLGFPPFRGGPFRYIAATGKEKVREMLENLAKKQDMRFKPARGLEG